MEKLLKGVCQWLCGVRRTAVLAGPSLIRNPCTRKRDPLITGHSLTHTDMTLSGATQGPSQGPVHTHTATGGWGGRERENERDSSVPNANPVNIFLLSNLSLPSRTQKNREKQR